jgi:hypothetical protein
MWAAGSGHDDAVDEDAGDADLAGRQSVAARHALDLDDHDPARVLRRLRDRERVQRGCLPLHCHVALLVRRRAAQERHVDRASRIEQELFAFEFDDLHQRLGRHRIHATAPAPRVGEGAQPDPRDDARPPRRRLAVQMGHHAQREAVGLDPPVAGQRPQRWDEPPMGPDRAAEKPHEREAVEPAGAAVALTAREHER